MKLKLTLAAAIATGLMCGTAAAQTYDTLSGAIVYPSGTVMYSDGTYGYVTPGGSYVYPSTTTVVTPAYVAPSSTVVVPIGEPMAGTRNVYVPSETPPPGQNYTPNPNKVQNNGVPTQFDMPYAYDGIFWYRTDRMSP